MPDMPNNNSDYLQKLKDLLSKAGQNMDSSGNMISNQVALAQKQLANPSYQPSPEEQANQKNYYNSVTGAVAGSVAPVEKAIPSQLFKALPEGENLGLVQQFQNRLAQVGKTGLSGDELKNAAQQLSEAAGKKGISSGVSPELMQALQEKSTRELAQKEATDAAMSDAKKKALASLASQGK